MEKLCVEKFICLSKDDSYGQVLSLNSFCFYMSEGFGVKAKMTHHLGTFVMQLLKWAFFFITELKITGFHCSCMSVTLYK